jgi:hypothetical protein
MSRAYTVGDWVVYTRGKVSPSPGPRAKNVSPAQHGELYSYQVDKYWTVREIRDQKELILETRRGKVHAVPVNDSRLRKPSWWERLLYANRFPSSQPKI